MNANQIIEAYVADVAIRLPRARRNGVAFELRTLLHEELQDRADAAGREADAAMATEYLNAFGHPVDVAARYRPQLGIIDPADGPAFLRASVVGLLLIWTAGLLAEWPSLASGEHTLSVIGRWWVGTVVGSLWWPGVLVTGYGLAHWIRSTRARAPAWAPRSADRIAGSRATLALGLVGIVCGLLVLVQPVRLLEIVLGGQVPDAARQALAYVDDVWRGPMAVLLGLVALNVPLLLWVMVAGQWSAALRRVETALALATCAVMAWTVFAGPVFASAAADKTFRFALVMLIALIAWQQGARLYHRVTPRPD